MKELNLFWLRSLSQGMGDCRINNRLEFQGRSKVLACAIFVVIHDLSLLTLGEDITAASHLLLRRPSFSSEARVHDVSPIRRT